MLLTQIHLSSDEEACFLRSHFLHYSFMPNIPMSEDTFESLQEIVQVLRYLVVRDEMRLGPEGLKQAKATVNALVAKFNVPPIPIPPQ